MIRIDPTSTALFRENSNKPKIVFTGTRRCQGPCKMARSLTQFANGDVLCKQCRRRA